MNDSEGCMNDAKVEETVVENRQDAILREIDALFTELAELMREDDSRGIFVHAMVQKKIETEGTADCNLAVYSMCSDGDLFKMFDVASEKSPVLRSALRRYTKYKQAESFIDALFGGSKNAEKEKSDE